MHYLYALYSDSTDKYYVGETNDLDARLVKHNNHFYRKSYTKSASDWEVVLDKRCNNREEALYLEDFIKRMKSKKFIKKIIANSKILDNILSKK